MSVPLMEAILAQMPHQQVIVLGDVILDEYLIGEATRMSREAPIPVLEFIERRHIPGGAANPAVNIAALGAKAVQIGVVGEDAAADHLRGALQARHVQTDGLIPDATRPTTVKMRLLAQMGLHFPQQVARMDTLSRTPISDGLQARVVEHLQAALPHSAALLLSDYHGGMLTPALVESVRIRAEGRLLTADAQGDFTKYAHFGLVKCNAAEAANHLGRALHTAADFAAAAQALCDGLQLTVGMVITRGADGATLAEPNGAVTHCPAPTITDVFDTVGAGDTAIAVMTLALCAGASPVAAVSLANYASGIVVRKVGNYAPSLDELRAAIVV